MTATAANDAVELGCPGTDPGGAAVKSLKARWNRRLAVLVVVLAVGGLGTLVAAHHMVDAFRETAQRLEADASRSARLRAQIAEHANLGHSLMERDDDNNERRLAALETSIRADLAEGASGASDGAAGRLLRKAGARWQQGADEIESYDRSASVAARTDAHMILADRSAAAARLIDEAAAAGRAIERTELARAEQYAGYAMAALGAAAALLVGLVLRLGRRLRVEVLRPLTRLRDSAERFGAGELDHRAAVDRADELGELAASFNTMADAITRTHGALSREAHHDSLTGLANRAAFRSRLEAALSHPERRAGTQAVVFVDLDDFKDVNDALGHAAGDELLTVVGARLAEAVRPGDVAARLGGDEFAILLDGVADPAAAAAVADRAVATIAGPVELAGSVVRIAASAGFAMREGGADASELMRRADAAMYLAKGRGKNRVECHDAALDEEATARTQLKAEIRAAAARDELLVEYQPIVDLASGSVASLEALVRWEHPTRGRLGPSQFIALAEETGAIAQIGTWVLNTAAAQLRSWQDTHGLPGVAVSVNVSARQLDTPGFADHVEHLLRRAGIEPGCLILEVTESALLDPTGCAATALAAIRRLGVRIALDDFGAGYSSIGYLRQLPVDMLKVDRSFVSGDGADAHGEVLLEAIVALGQRLGLEVIPEGVENHDQLARVLRLGCRKGQGFLLSRPVPPAAIDALLAATPLPVAGLAHSQEHAA